MSVVRVSITNSALAVVHQFLEVHANIVVLYLDIHFHGEEDYAATGTEKTA